MIPMIGLWCCSTGMPCQDHRTYSVSTQVNFDRFVKLSKNRAIGGWLNAVTAAAPLKVWVLTVDNQDVKRYTRTEAVCQFTPS